MDWWRIALAIALIGFLGWLIITNKNKKLTDIELDSTGGDPTHKPFIVPFNRD